MLITDDLVLVSETEEEVEEVRERWRAVIEKNGLRISRSKTEYMVPSHQQGVVKLEGEPYIACFRQTCSQARCQGAICGPTTC